MRGPLQFSPLRPLITNASQLTPGVCKQKCFGSATAAFVYKFETEEEGLVLSADVLLTRKTILKRKVGKWRWMADRDLLWSV